MKNLDCTTLATVVKSLYDEVYQPRQGSVSITPLVLPNAILIVGRPENVKTVKDLAVRLDQPSIPGADFHIFHLSHAAASGAVTTVQNFFSTTGGLSPTVRVTADVRSNSLVVQASSRDMEEVAKLISQIDVPGVSGGVVNEVRIVRLEHTVAAEIANVMMSAIFGSGQSATTQGGQGGGQGGQPGGPGGPGGGQPGGAGGQPGGQGQECVRRVNRSAGLDDPLSHGRCQGPQNVDGLGDPR